MKLILLLLFLIGALPAVAQLSRQKQTDSVCFLVRKYFNEKAYDSLYQLTGKTFRSRVSAGTFKVLAGLEFAPLGEMEQPVLEEYTNGMGWYKVFFPSRTLTLLLSLDSQNKLEFFRLKKGNENLEIHSSNPLRTDIDQMIDGVARGYMMQENTVEFSIGILKDGKTYFYGYGETAKGNGIIPNASTVFEIASVTKTFTATLLAIA